VARKTLRDAVGLRDGVRGGKHGVRNYYTWKITNRYGIVNRPLFTKLRRKFSKNAAGVKTGHAARSSASQSDSVDSFDSSSRSSRPIRSVSTLFSLYNNKRIVSYSLACVCLYFRHNLYETVQAVTSSSSHTRSRHTRQFRMCDFRVIRI